MNQYVNKPVTLARFWFLSWPLVLMSLSTISMNAIDALILSRLSVNAFNAVSGATAYLQWVQQPFIMLILGAQIFSGIRLKKHQSLMKHAQPLVQMMLITTVLAIPLGLFCAYFFPQLVFEGYNNHIMSDLVGRYFNIIVLFTWLVPLSAGFAGIFHSQGSTGLVSICYVICQILNAGLNVVLIWGVQGVIPSMGVAGAAYATVCSQFVFCVTLGVIAYRQSNGTIFNSLYQMERSLIRISFEYGLGMFLRKIVGSTFFMMSAHLIYSMDSKGYILIYSLGSWLTRILHPFAKSIEDGLKIYFSALVGAGRFKCVYVLIRHAMTIITIASISVFLMMLSFRDLAFWWFEIHEGLLTEANVVWMIIPVWFFVVECVKIPSALLTVMKDNLFLTVSAAFDSIFMLYVPIYVCTQYYPANPELIWLSIALGVVINGVMRGVRLRYKLSEKPYESVFKKK
jgi:multidrug resistance protein, MATE family